jgi:hypothetical protein
MCGFVVMIFCIILSFLVDSVVCMRSVPGPPMDITGIRNSVDTAVPNSITIREWSDASMHDAARDVLNNPLNADSVKEAKWDSLRRRLRILLEPFPHVAILRVVYGTRRVFAGHSVPRVFSSTIQHGAAGARFSARTAGRLDALSCGIAPYKGSPCRFAHSERAIGVYLEGALSNIVPAGSSFALI